MKFTHTIAALLVAAFPFGTFAADNASKPNIVIIVADDMGYNDPGFMGGTECSTPALDALAKTGAILTSHYVQPVCSPTRAALMTGRLATKTGVYTIVRPGAHWGLPLGQQTMAQMLREAGYETAICGKWHLGEFEKAYQPTQRGFDHQYGHFFGAIDYFTHKRDGKEDWYRDDKPLHEEGYSTELVAKEACRLIRAKSADKPLFLYVPFNAVHAPHQAPEHYITPFTKLTGVRKTYAGMTAAMDKGIADIVAALDNAKIRENTIIVFSSDNGGPSPGKVTDNTPLRAGKGTIYEGGVRACAFALWPGHIKAGQKIGEPVHISDWMPTLAKIAGGKPSNADDLDGQDILPVLTAGAKSPHDSILIVGTLPEHRAIRVGDWKLLMNADDSDAEEETTTQATRKKGGKKSAAPAFQLYNLATDIGEKTNLAQANPEKVAELRAKLDARMKGAVAPGGSAGN